MLLELDQEDTVFCSLSIFPKPLKGFATRVQALTLHRRGGAHGWQTSQGYRPSTGVPIEAGKFCFDCALHIGSLASQIAPLISKSCRKATATVKGGRKAILPGDFCSGKFRTLSTTV
jgi:hypothetical protein